MVRLWVEKFRSLVAEVDLLPAMTDVIDGLALWLGSEILCSSGEGI